MTRGRPTPNVADLLWERTAVVPVGVGQSGSRHIGETFDALGTSLKCVLSIQLLHAYWTKFSPRYSLNFFSLLLPIYMQSLCQYRRLLAKSFGFKESPCLTADKPLIPGDIQKVSSQFHVSIEADCAGLGYFLYRLRTANRFNRKQHCVILKHSFNCWRTEPGGFSSAAI